MLSAFNSGLETSINPRLILQLSQNGLETSINLRLILQLIQTFWLLQNVLIWGLNGRLISVLKPIHTASKFELEKIKNHTTTNVQFYINTMDL